MTCDDGLCREFHMDHYLLEKQCVHVKNCIDGT